MEYATIKKGQGEYQLIIKTNQIEGGKVNLHTYRFLEFYQGQVD